MSAFDLLRTLQTLLIVRGMQRLFLAFLWLLLVPYFAVASINAPAWAGESRETTNRANAQLTVAFMLCSLEIAILAVAGLSRGELWDKHLYIVCAGLFVPPWIFVARWLNKSRESDYRMQYRRMSLGARLAFGLIAATFVFACWSVVGKA
jgi:hypothetical protein